jgi:cyanuric acid amidohydrolase
MVEVVAENIEKMLQDNSIEASDTHFVQIKCPLLSSRDIAESRETLATNDTLKSMGLSRGAASLGVALALGELPRSTVFQSQVGEDLSRFSSVASTSAGIELRCCEILLLANSGNSNSPFRIGHDVMTHNLDTQAILRAGEKSQSTLKQFDPSRVLQIFAKAEAAPSGRILGQRHTMLQDSDISPTRMSRAVVAAVAASIIQDPMVYVSGGAEHQGPPGGGPVAVLSRII